MGKLKPYFEDFDYSSAENMNEVLRKNVEMYRDRSSFELKELSREQGYNALGMAAKTILSERYKGDKIFSKTQAMLVVWFTGVMAVCAVLSLIVELSGK